MTDKVIVYTNPKSGILAVCIPALEGRRPDESEDAWLDRVKARSVPADAQDVRVMSMADIPQDRTFRNAWVMDDGRPAVSMARARELHRYNIRRRRKAKFRDLDAQHLRALEAGDATALAAVAAAKKKLRNAPAHPDIDAAQTPEQLKAVWPL